MKSIIFIFTLILFLLQGLLFAQKDNKMVRDGNKLYESGKFDQAEKNYRKSLELNKDNLKAAFNLGDALYKQKKYTEADSIFKGITERTDDKNLLSKIYHNLGNSLLESKKYEESVQAYKNSLKNSPDEKETKYNLAYAQAMLKKQQQQQQKQQQNKNQKKDNKDKEKDKKEQDQNKQEQQQQQQKQNKDKMSKEDMERMLEAMNKKEKDTKEKIKKARAVSGKGNIDKDW